jgi:pimeloyl-ACP methyl ester carboxylesterase
VTPPSAAGTPGAVANTTEDLADDAVRVLDAFGVDRAHLVGMSLGGSWRSSSPSKRRIAC